MYEEYLKKNIIKIVVKPNSSKTEIISYDPQKEALKVNVKAEPEKGKANAEVIKFFSKLTKKKVRILRGGKSKVKVLKLD